jgi:hypothetical protein
MTTELDDLRAELAALRAELEDMRRQMLRAEHDRDSALQEVADLDAHLESVQADWEWMSDCADWWEDAARDEALALAEERRERAALVRHEVERELGREPKRRGRPPTWRPETEDEVARLHREGRSIRDIAAELRASKTHVHRVVARVRRQQEEAAEFARLRAISEGRSPAQRKARASRAKAEQEMARRPEREAAERSPEARLKPAPRTLAGARRHVIDAPGGWCVMVTNSAKLRASDTLQLC